MKNNSPTVLDRLEAARTAIKRADKALDKDQAPDIRAVETEVDLAAAAATSLDANAARETRPALLNLVADLNALHARIKKERNATANLLGSLSTQRRAVSAYARHPNA